MVLHCFAVGVDSAYAAILTIVETTVEEFRLSDESITCLLMDKALRVNQLQTKHAVRTPIPGWMDGWIHRLIDRDLLDDGDDDVIGAYGRESR